MDEDETIPFALLTSCRMGQRGHEPDLLTLYDGPIQGDSIGSHKTMAWPSLRRIRYQWRTG